MKFKDISKEELEKVINNNNSLSGVLREMGYSTKSGNFQTLHRYGIKYGLTDKINSLKNSKEKYIGNSNGIIHNLEDILVENSTYGNTNSLKRRLYRNKIKERKCELCGQTEEWRGIYMSLILDHINGIHTDNRLENLRIVCPNCNATLPTHCRGNTNNLEI